MWLFYVVQKLGDDIFFSFMIALNFLIKVWVFFSFKNTLKKIQFFLF
jgi:hypothetical protein